MKKRVPLIVSVAAIIIVLFFYAVFGMSPPEGPPELVIRKGGMHAWKLSNDQIVYGETIWSHYATHSGETLKLWHCSYWGGLILDKKPMSWEDEKGIFSSEPLTFDSINRSSQNGVLSMLKFKYENRCYRVYFSVPQLEEGNYKYSDLGEAWNKGELLQIIEEW